MKSLESTPLTGHGFDAENDRVQSSLDVKEPYGVEALRDVDPRKEMAMLACLTVLDTAVGSGDGNKTSTVDDEFKMAQGDFGLEASNKDLFDLAA
jgi:hypothetical protein